MSSTQNAATRPTVCFIPGGPGLGSDSLGKSPAVKSYFDVVYLEPPTGPVGFDDVVIELERQVLALKRPVILVGHSFGGFYATSLVARNSVEAVGWVGLATCASARAWTQFAERSATLRTPSRVAAEMAFFTQLSEPAFRGWLLSLLDVYFHPRSRGEGRELLSKIALSPESFLSVSQSMGDRVFTEGFERLKTFRGKKLLILGEGDSFFPPATLTDDAMDIGATLVSIAGANHFLTIDNDKAFAETLRAHFHSMGS